MSNAKFTPGPWSIKAIPDGSEPSRKYSQYIVGPNVCDVFYTNDVGRANAHLIAAAPELYEALQAILFAARLDAPDTAAWKELRKSCEDALSKARGESE